MNPGGVFPAKDLDWLDGALVMHRFDDGGCRPFGLAVIIGDLVDGSDADMLQALFNRPALIICQGFVQFQVFTGEYPFA